MLAVFISFFGLIIRPRNPLPRRSLAVKKTLSVVLFAFAGVLCVISALYIWHYFHRQALRDSAATLNTEVLQEMFGAADSNRLGTHAAEGLQLPPAPDLGRLVVLEELSSTVDIPPFAGSGEAVMRSTSRAHLLLGTVEIDTEAVYRDGQWWFTGIVTRTGGRAQ